MEPQLNEQQQTRPAVVAQNMTRGRRIKKDESRKVFDNIHGFIRFEKRIWKFIDTPQFQRLKNIKQLGCLNMVFPGVTHSRFQHSLGTGHLAKTFITQLIENNPERYKQQQKQSAIFTVTLAGIMHDVGHGPFSHTFDGEIVKTKLLKKGQSEVQEEKFWEHEIGSELIFRHIVEKYNLLGREIKNYEVQRVVNLIHGASDGIRQWEFELISNKETGIDVDKLDYFRRDAFYLGAKGIQIDHQLLMSEARILEQQRQGVTKLHIGYPSKYALQVNDIFYSRYKLYKTYYLNNVSKGIQFMIMDILKEVQPIYKFTQICRHIKQGSNWIMKYCELTDGILERIQFLDLEHYQGNEDFVRRIGKAKELLLRINNRKIYKFLREVQTSITLERLANDREVLQSIFNRENITRFIENDTKLSRSLFHIAVTEAGYGLKKINPLDRVKFFRKQEFDEQDGDFKCLSEEDFKAQNISILYTKAFAERYAKLYVTSVENMQDVKLINAAFVKYFDNKKRQCGDMFNHMSIGRTSYYATEQTEERQIQLTRQFQGNNKDNEDNLP